MCVCVCVRVCEYCDVGTTVLFTLCAGMQVLQQEGSRGREPRIQLEQIGTS